MGGKKRAYNSAAARAATPSFCRDYWELRMAHCCREEYVRWLITWRSEGSKSQGGGNWNLRWVKFWNAVSDDQPFLFLFCQRGHGGLGGSIVDDA